MVDKLHALPGHRSKFSEFFKIIDHLYPKSTIKKQIDQAATQVEGARNFGVTGSTLRKAGSQNRSITRRNLSPEKAEEPTRPAVGKPAAPKKLRNGSNSLVRRYNTLDTDAKQAINETFLINVKARRNQLTV